MIKEFIRKYFYFLFPIVLIPEYIEDLFRYLKYSGVLWGKNDQLKLRGIIMADYHKIEKGLIMINFRKGFGEKKIQRLVNNCLIYIEKYGLSDIQIKQTIAVLIEYLEVHNNFDFALKEEIKNKIDLLSPYMKNINASSQLKFEKTSYFNEVESSFPNFSRSRKSIRNYSEEDLNVEKIKQAISLARTSPSVCNRQSSHVHIITDKKLIEKLLKIQGGANGFSHVVNKLLIVTTDLSSFHGVYERNEAYIDGGLFSMNLLYGLHYNKIAACALNCCFPHKKNKLIRKLCNINNSEILIMMISCGNVPENFNSAIALRDPIEKYMTIH